MCVCNLYNTQTHTDINGKRDIAVVDVFGDFVILVVWYGIHPENCVNMDGITNDHLILLLY